MDRIKDEQSERWPKPQPEIETVRLILRPLVLLDAKQLQLLAGDYAIADTTLNIAHPYPDGLAEEWIATRPSRYDQACEATFAVTLKDNKGLIGVAGLGFTKRFHRAELGYWITKSLWNMGYATEAAKAVVGFGFSHLALHKIEANHLKRNPSSGSVLKKLGFEQEGVLRGHVMKWDRFEDIVVYGLLRPSVDSLPEEGWIDVMLARHD
jgi:[ribosomal protein S5]-alanine N-acetyltransferase